jgi:hypothetical protein
MAMSTRITTTIVLFALFAATASAQLSASIAVDQAAQGDRYLLTLEDRSGLGAIFTDTCIVKEARLWSSKGHTVWLANSCGDMVTYLAPKQSLVHGWEAKDNAGNVLASGTYSLRVCYQIPGSLHMLEQWFEVRHAVLAPRVIARSDAIIGAGAVIGIEAPSHRFGSYIAGASLSLTSTMIDDALHRFLAIDAVFLNSMTSPDEGLFRNFQGSLGAEGQALDLVVNLPDAPDLVGLGFYVQALVRTDHEPGAAPRFTGPRYFEIQDSGEGE